MTTAAIKKQVQEYLPLLSTKQQVLVLEMIKSLLQVDHDVNRASRSQYNKEIDEAVERIENGNSISHADVLKDIAKW